MKNRKQKSGVWMLEKPYFVSVEYGGLTVRSNVERCKKCGCYIDRENAEFSATDKPVRRFSLFASSDGFYVASQKFKKFCQSNGFFGVDFVALENGYFALKVARYVPYDLEKFDYVNQTRWCSECESFESSLVSPYSRVLAADTVIDPLELVESCEVWGQDLWEGTAKGPDLLVGVRAASLLKDANFKGLSLLETS